MSKVKDALAYEPDPALEVWKPVVGYEGLYEVSNFGRVKSLVRSMYDINKKAVIDRKREKLLKQHIHKSGYWVVCLTKGGRLKHIYTHRLVAEAFLGGHSPTDVVNHKDLDKTNCHIDNLEYVSFRGNIQHAWENGVERSALTQEDVLEIKRRFRNGETTESIHADYPFVIKKTIRNIERGVTWKWVK